jgi:aminomethyltransferase
MDPMADALRHSPLEPAHQELGAKLGPFGGWLMPIEYEGVLAEHRAVRERVGLFDLTHLGKVDVRGPGALGALQRTLSNDLAKVDVGRAQYNLVLNERGGIDEDLIVYRLTEDRWFVVPNASNTDRVVTLLSEAADGPVVEPHPTWCFLGVQGPGALETVGARFPEAADLPYMGCAEASFDGTPVVLTRSGYTGELGYELFGPAEIAADLWDELAEAGAAFGIEPCGLRARDVLRLEMGYPLYGQDLRPDRPARGRLRVGGRARQGGASGRNAAAPARGGCRRGCAGWSRGRGQIPPAPGRPGGRGRRGKHHERHVLTDPRHRTRSRTLAGRAVRGAGVSIDIRGRPASATVTRPPFVDRSPRG